MSDKNKKPKYRHTDTIDMNVTIVDNVGEEQAKKYIKQLEELKKRGLGFILKWIILRKMGHFMNNIEIKRITRKQLWAELEEGLITFTLFGGSRLFFVDEVLAAYKNDVFVGAVSLSPYNEMGFAAPSIIGLLVLEDYRRQGIGRKLMEKAITRMQERHLTPVNIDVLSKNAMNLINTLNPAFKKDLTMNDMSEFDCFDVLAKTKGNVLIF